MAGRIPIVQMDLASREGPGTTCGLWLGHRVAGLVDNGMTDRPVEDENETVGQTRDTVSGGGVRLGRPGETGVCRVVGNLDLGATIVRTGQRGSGRCRSSDGSHGQDRRHEESCEIHLQDNLAGKSKCRTRVKTF